MTFYCPKCQLLIDKSEVEKEGEQFVHIVAEFQSLEADHTHYIKHNLIVEP